MKNTYSIFASILIIAVIIGIAFSFTSYHVLAWDTMGYHVYLTQWLVNHDMHIYNLDFYTHIQNTYQNTSTLYQFVTLPNGEFITRYPFGWALLNLPFIVVGHLFAVLLHYPTDGFSLPYQIAAYSSSLFYMALGIYWLRKVLLHFFSDKQTVLLLISVAFGTNYLHLNSETLSLIHIFLFPLYALLILQTIKFYQTYKLKNALGIGFNKLTSKDHVWIRGVGIVEPQSSFENYSSHFVMMMLHNKEAYTWRNKPIQSKQLAPYQKDTLIFDYLTPEIRSNNDLLSVGFWHQSGDSILVYDFYIEVWEPIK